MKERLKRLERLVQVAGIDATSKTILLIREEFYKLEERLKIAEESKVAAEIALDLPNTSTPVEVGAAIANLYKRIKELEDVRGDCGTYKK